MRVLKLMLLAPVLLSSSLTWAAIDCRPGMGGGCPGPADNSGTAPRGNGEAYTTLAIGYAEVASSDCNSSDLKYARAQAKANSKHIARQKLKADDVVLTKKMFFEETCAPGVYVEPNTQISWLVRAFGTYKAAH